MPTRGDDVVVPASRTVEVDIVGAEARTVTVEGNLQASRTRATRLDLYGNLIVRGFGSLDYGRANDRVLVPATIRFFLDESRFVGGMTMVPLATDVGLWAIGDARVFMHGDYRDAWSELRTTAAAGSTEILVQPGDSVGWRAGDLLAIAATRRGYGVREERRRIAAVLSPGRFSLDAPLLADHIVQVTNWTDTWGDTWQEVMAGKVANLTSNLRLEAADPNHRPHVQIMERARAYLEDVAIQNFSPTPKFVGYDQRTDLVIPFGRYAWHFHIQDGNSRGSYLRRVRIYDGIGNGLSVHESWGIEVTDLVVVNQARTSIRVTGGTLNANAPIFLERSVENRYGENDDQGHACDDGYVDRSLVMGAGGFDERAWGHGMWLMASRNCAVVGHVAAGGYLSSGIFWAEGAGQREIVHAYRLESFGNGYGFFSWHNRSPEDSALERVVDLLAWRNDTGLAWGAYITTYWGHQYRSIGNQLAIIHWAMGWGLTGFLFDGLGGAGTTGLQIGRYATASLVDTVYEDGLVRNVATNWTHENSPDFGAVSKVQLTRIRWQPYPGAGFRFDGNTVPPLNSYVRVRGQTGLGGCLYPGDVCPANMTLYRLEQVGVGGVADTRINAIRVDGDTAGTRPATPRVKLTAPTNEALVTGLVVLTAESNAAQVVFWNANRVLGTVPVVGGRATLTVNLGTWPYRRAYFWAHATTNGMTNTSRVVRVRRF